MKTRRKFICDVVENYKEQHKEEYKAFLELMKHRKSDSNDKKFAELNGAKEIRVAMSMPEGIDTVFSVVLTGEKEEKFGEPKGELKWFTKKYPQFLISNKY